MEHPFHFAAHVRRALVQMPDTATVGSFASDLYLACACLIGVARSSETFVARYQQLIRRVAGKVPDATAARFSRKAHGPVVGRRPPRPVERLRRPIRVGPLAGGGIPRSALQIVANSVTGGRRHAAYSEPEGRPTRRTWPSSARYMAPFQDALRDHARRCPETDHMLRCCCSIEERARRTEIGERLGVFTIDTRVRSPKSGRHVRRTSKLRSDKTISMSLVELDTK